MSAHSGMIAVATTEMSQSLDSTVCEQLRLEFTKALGRFRRGDWEPHGCNAGKFAEAAAKLFYEMDGGKPNSGKGVSGIVKYLRDDGNTRTHFLDAKDRNQAAKVLATLYKLRSARGVVHLSDSHVANHLDAGLMIALVKWLMAECLRIGWKSDLDEVTAVVNSVITQAIPAVGRYGDRYLVERTDCTNEEEILLILYASGRAMTANELHRHVKCDSKHVNTYLGRLREKVLVVRLDSGAYQLTQGAGVLYVEQELGDKMVLQSTQSDR